MSAWSNRNMSVQLVDVSIGSRKHRGALVGCSSYGRIVCSWLRGLSGILTETVVHHVVFWMVFIWFLIIWSCVPRKGLLTNVQRPPPLY